MFAKKEEVYLGKNLKQSASREIKHEISLIRCDISCRYAVFERSYRHRGFGLDLAGFCRCQICLLMASQQDEQRRCKVSAGTDLHGAYRRWYVPLFQDKGLS